MVMYTEEDLRKAFKAGIERGAWIDRGNFYDEPLSEHEYIENLNPKSIEEEKICFSYSFLRRKLDWLEFCELTGLSEYCRKEGYEIKDTDTFEITESKAKQFNLI